MNLFDLRKYNVTNLKDAVEFLELFEAKIPQIKKVIKSQSLKVASLENRLKHAERPIVQAAAPQQTTVAQTITGKADSTVNQRLEQLRSAAEQASLNERIKKAAADVRVGKMPSAGEIGQLNIPDVDPTPPKDIDPPALEPDTSEPAEENNAPTLEGDEPKEVKDDTVSGNTARKEAKNETTASIVIKRKSKGGQK